MTDKPLTPEEAYDLAFKIQTKIDDLWKYYRKEEAELFKDLEDWDALSDEALENFEKEI